MSDTGNRVTESHTYANGSTTTLPAKQESVYDSATKLLTESRVYEAASGASTGNYLKTAYSYDNATRRVKVTQPQGGFQKTLFASWAEPPRSHSAVTSAAARPPRT